MADVLAITGTIFALIGLGFGAVRLGAFSRADLGTLSKYVVNFALPALIFRAISTRDLTEFFDIGYLGGYFMAALAVLVLGYWLGLGLFGQTRAAATFNAMGMSCSNSAFIGYPILMMALPDLAATAVALNLTVENIVLIPLILILAERASGTTRGWPLAVQTLRRLAMSPIIVALMVGLAVSLSGLAMPQAVDSAVRIMADSSAAVSLFVIGGTLVGLRLRGAFSPAVGAVVLGKLLVLPAALWLGFRVMAALGHPTGDPALEVAGILMAATPAMTIYPVLAMRHGQGDTAALAMLAQTILSFFTISALMLLL